MNVGLLGSNYLQTTTTAQTAQGLQAAVSPVSQAETLTRINSTQNTSSAENKPNSQQGENTKNADEVANQYTRLGKNVNNYKPKDEEEKEEKHGRHQGTEGQSDSMENSRGLSEEDLEKIRELEKRDREVRTHEQAHMATAGQYANGGIHFETKTGPDGKSYVVGGHVNIDTSPVPNNPQATLQKANKIRAAALAPAEPSAQDKSVASEAAKLATEARIALAKERQEEFKESYAKTKDIGEDPLKVEVKNNTATSEYRKVADLNNELTPETNPFYQVA
jgi:hypothetical protein